MSKFINKDKRYKPLFLIGTNKDLDFLVEQLYILLSAGMPMSEALKTIQKEVRTRQVKGLLGNAIQDVENGTPLWRALKDAQLMPPNFISLVKVGEQSGNLVEQLKIVSDQYQRDKDFRNKIITASIYPVFVLVITFVVGIFTALFILPRFATTFDQFGVEMPFLTRILIELGVYFSENGVLTVAIAVSSFILLIFILFIQEDTKSSGQWLMRNIPGIKRLILEVELSRFGFILGTLLNAGIPIIQALEFLAELTTTKAYEKLYMHLRDNIENGITFKKSLDSYKRSNKLIPISYQNLISSAEKSSTLPDSLLKMGKIFGERMENTSKNISVVLEPILLIVVWSIVLVVALGVVMPIYSLIGGIESF